MTETVTLENFGEKFYFSGGTSMQPGVTMLHAQYPMPAMSPFCRPDYMPKMPMAMPNQIPSQVYAPHAFEGILELRKEKSRDAARSRRGKENYEFYELAKMLPLPGAITSQLDKASIIRLTISFLKLRDFSSHGDPPWQRDGPSPNKSSKGVPSRRRSTSSNLPVDLFEAHQGTHILQSLDGFAFALSNDGRFLYISETVSIYLGLSQVEMTGSSIFDYVHVQDHQEVTEQLGLNAPQCTAGAQSSEDGSSTPRSVTPSMPERVSLMNPSPSKSFDRCFCMRMKSTLTKRGVHVKSSGYRVVQILIHMRPQFSFALTRKHPPPLLGAVGVAVALPPPTMTELLIDNDMFVTRFSPSLKITYCEPRIGDMMDLTADDLTGNNLYDYCHAEDLQKLRKAHVDLLAKGQVLTDYYRLMNKHGGFVWVQTCATIICNVKNAEEQNIIAINYVLSGIEYVGCVMNTTQLKLLTKVDSDQSDPSENEQMSEKEEKDKYSKSSNGKSDHSGEDGGLPSSRGRGHKRRRSSSPANDHQSLESMLSNHCMAASNGFDPGNVEGAALGGMLLDEGDKSGKYRLDVKNSRRKSEKPRKRKKDDDSEVERNNNLLDLSLGSTDGTLDLDMSNNNDLLGKGDSIIQENGMLTGPRPDSARSSTATPSGVSPNLIPRPQSPVAEDLSMRTPLSHSPPNLLPQSPLHHTSHSSPGLTPVIAIATQSGMARNSGSGSLVGRDAWGQSGAGTCNSDSASDLGTPTNSSVRELEEAMNKHLPSLGSEMEPLRGSIGVGQDYSQSVLSLHQKHKSTIQWIGSQSSHGATETLPATNLLRSLYANRESVIRTNVYNPRPQYHYHGDVQNNLLTPPGGATDPFKDYGSATNSQIENHAKTPPCTSAYSSYVGNYSSSPISVSMGTTMSDAYAMTPPSSVSPQEKFVSQFADQSHIDMAGLRQYETSLTMPIKPQVYPLPAHANSHLSAYDRSVQYSSAGYYSPGFTSYSMQSPTPAHFRETSRTANPW